jgi:Secretion system C-terminal sorting domain
VAIYSSTSLPVTLINFTVTKQGTDARLNWSTTEEDSNKGFEIQRSTDASTWTVLGFVAGAGTSQVQHDYQYLDMNLAPGTYYYRLRQVDYDEHSQFSKIVPVTFDGGLVLTLKQNRPNPFNNNTTIEMIIPKYCQVQLIMYDQMGRPVQQLVDEFKQAGTYDIPVNKNGLSSGIYYYKMNALGQSITKKMTIL